MHGVATAIRRSGLTRDQIYYVEDRGYLGPVQRQGKARRYTEAQLAKLERIGAGRRLGLRLDEAGPIATAFEARDRVDIDRLSRLALAKMRQISTELDALDYVLTMLFDTTTIGRAPGAAA